MPGSDQGGDGVTYEWRRDAPSNQVQLAVGRCLIAVMDASRWTELGLLTDTVKVIDRHPRLLRSLRFGDDDYGACVFDMVPALLNEQKPRAGDLWLPPQPALSLHQRFPNLEVVADFIDLPEWLAEHEDKLFHRLFDDAATDATLPDGTVLSAAESAAARLEVGEMRRQVERIRRDHATDPESSVGQAKDLVETVCRTILGLTGDTAGAEKPTFPQLVKRTMLHLGIDPSQAEQHSKDAVEARIAKQMVGAIASLLNGADELRNARGTGHGRSGAPLVDQALARMTVSLVMAAVVYLIEIFESQTGSGAAPELVAPARVQPQALKVGSVVLHRTFGEGRVLAVVGAGNTTKADVDFGADIGIKRLSLRHADLVLRG